MSAKDFAKVVLEKWKTAEAQSFLSAVSKLKKNVERKIGIKMDPILERKKSYQKKEWPAQNVIGQSDFVNVNQSKLRI